MSLQSKNKFESYCHKIQYPIREADFDPSLNSNKSIKYQRKIFYHKGNNITLTEKQINLLRLVAKGFSNIKIARELNKKESAIKLSIHRIMKYLEVILNENIDRFYLIIVAQELDL